MMQKKRTNYIETLRRESHEQFKKKVRNQLTSLVEGRLDQQSQKLSFVNESDINDEWDQSQQTNRTLAVSPKQQQRIINLIQRFRYLMENQSNISGQQYSKQGHFSCLLRDYRLIIFKGQGLVDFQFIGKIFLFIKSKIQLALESVNCHLDNLNLVSQWEGLINVRNLFNLTLMFLISEFIHQGGVICEQKMKQNWLIRQYFLWMYQLERYVKEVKQILQNSYDKSDLDSLASSKNMQILRHYLQELRGFVSIIEHYNKGQQYSQIILYLFSQNNMKTFVAIMRNYSTPDTISLLLTDIFFFVGGFRLVQFFESLVKSQFVDYVKLQLLLHQDYKNYTRKTQLSHAQKININIISNILYILSQISTQHGSKILWQSGICQQIKYIIGQISKPDIKQDFITFMLCALVNIRDEGSMKMANDSDMMEWVLSVIQSRTSFIKTNTLKNQNNSDKILEDCLIALGFFFQIGKVQMSVCHDLTRNPYEVKFQYLRGQQMLRYFPQGQQLLDKINQSKFI